MKIIVKLSTLLLASFLVCTCSSSETSEKDSTRAIIKIQLDSDESISKEKLFIDPKFIPLDTTGGGVIGGVGKVIFDKNKFYILDVVGRSVMVFDESGKFLRKIGNPGEGPATINIIYDFQINKFTGLVELLSPKGGIVSYNFENDKYSDLFTLKNKLPSINYMSNINEDLVVFYSKFSDYRLNYYSRSSDEIVFSELKNNYKNAVNMVHISPFIDGEKSKRYIDYYDGTLYDIYESGAVQTEIIYHNVNPVSGSLIPENTVKPNMVKKFLSENSIVYPIVNWTEFKNKKIFLILLDGSSFQIINCDTEKNLCKSVGDKFNVPIMPFATKVGDKNIGLIYNHSHLSGFFPNSISLDEESKYSVIAGENPILFKY